MDYLDQDQGFSPQTVSVMSKSGQKKEAAEGSKMLMQQKGKKVSKREDAIKAIMKRMEDSVKEYNSIMSDEYPDAQGDETLADPNIDASEEAESVGMSGENMAMDADTNEVKDGDPETDIMVVGKGKDGSNYEAGTQVDEGVSQNDKKLKISMLAATLKAKLRPKKG